MTRETKQKLAFDLNTLDVLLDSIAQSAADPRVDRAALYASINNKLIASTQSLASAIFVQNKTGQVRVAHQSGLKELPQPLLNAIKPAVSDISTSRKSPIVRTIGHSRLYAGLSTPRNGLVFTYILIRDDQDNELAIQVFSDLVSEIAEQIRAFENLRVADQSNTSAAELTNIAQLVQNLGKARTLKEMSFHLVNDLAKITHADRVSYLSRDGKIQAVSGASRISFRTAVARTLTKIARLAKSTGASVEWNEGEVIVDGSRTPRGLRSLIEELPSTAGFAIPLTARGESAGLLLIEFFEPETAQQADPDDTSTAVAKPAQLARPELERRELVNQAVQFAMPVIGRAVQVFSIPAIGSLDLLFNRLLVRPVRSIIAFGLLVSSLLLAVYFLFGVTRPFEIFGEGLLQTVETQHIFAQIEGEVEELLVEEGATVEQGTRLAAVHSESLEKELILVEGEIAEANQELRNLELADFADPTAETPSATKNASDIERLKIRLTTLNKRLAFFDDQKKRLEVIAPISGVVTTPNLRQRLTERPIDRGDLLMTVANTDGQWEFELMIPDNRVEFVKAAQAGQQQPLEVIFRLASDSKRTYRGTLRELDYRSESNESEELATVRAIVDVDEAELGDSLRLGTRVYGKISCGQRSNYFLLTYEIENKIRQWLFR